MVLGMSLHKQIWVRWPSDGRAEVVTERPLEEGRYARYDLPDGPLSMERLRLPISIDKYEVRAFTWDKGQQPAGAGWWLCGTKTEGLLFVRERQTPPLSESDLRLAGMKELLLARLGAQPWCSSMLSFGGQCRFLAVGNTDSEGLPRCAAHLGRVLTHEEKWLEGVADFLFYQRAE